MKKYEDYDYDLSDDYMIGSLLAKGQLWCLVQRSRYGNPDLLKVNYFTHDDELRVTEYSFGECSEIIPKSNVLMFGEKTELLNKMKIYLEVKELIDNAKEKHPY